MKIGQYQNWQAMNDIKIDKLFHDKLDAFESKPSLDAWDKINDNIKKKKGRSSIWLYAIAASLVLAFSSTVIWMNIQTGDISETFLVENDGISNTKEIDTYSNNSISDIQQPVVTIQPAQVKDKIDININNTLPVENYISMDENTELHNLARPSEVIVIEKLEPELNLTHAQLNLDFNFLPENSTDLTLPENESGIKKAYEYAMRLKNGEESLIDLRKAKEDLFAMAKNIKINQSKTTN